jgi:hypothetical protein
MGDVVHLWRECAVCKLWFKPSSRVETVHPDCAAHQAEERAADPCHSEVAGASNLAALPAGAPITRTALSRSGNHEGHDDGVLTRESLEADIKRLGVTYPPEHLDDKDRS